MHGITPRFILALTSVSFLGLLTTLLGVLMREEAWHIPAQFGPWLLLPLGVLGILVWLRRNGRLNLTFNSWMITASICLFCLGAVGLMPAYYTAWQPLLTALAATLAMLSFVKIPLTSARLSGALQHPHVRSLLSFIDLRDLIDPTVLRAISLPIAALTTAIITISIRRDELFVPELFGQFVPFLIALFIWLSAMHRLSALRLSLQPALLGLSAAAFIVSLALFGNRDYAPFRELGIQIGVFAGMFAFVSGGQYWHYIALSPARFSFAVAAALCSKLYYLSSTFFWERMCQAAAILVGYILDPFIPNLDVTSRIGAPIIVASRHFGLEIYEPCSGLEGIFLFFFLLLAMFIVDWPLFKGRKWWLLFPFGVVYIFLFNGLRIASIFVLGHWAWQPSASAWQASFRTTPVEIFHSYAGWVYYLVAFAIFVKVFYSSVAREEARKHAQ